MIRRWSSRDATRFDEKRGKEAKDRNKMCLKRVGKIEFDDKRKFDKVSINTGSKKIC